MDLARDENPFFFPHRFQAGGQLSQLCMRGGQLLLRPFAVGNVQKDDHGACDLPLFNHGEGGVFHGE